MKNSEALQKGHEGGVGQLGDDLGNDQKVVVGADFFAFGEASLDDLYFIEDPASDHAGFFLGKACVLSRTCCTHISIIFDIKSLIWRKKLTLRL